MPPSLKVSRSYIFVAWKRLTYLFLQSSADALYTSSLCLCSSFLLFVCAPLLLTLISPHVTFNSLCRCQEHRHARCLPFSCRAWSKCPYHQCCWLHRRIVASKRPWSHDGHVLYESFRRTLCRSYRWWIPRRDCRVALDMYVLSTTSSAPLHSLQLTDWVLLIATGVCIVITIFFIPETYNPRLLRNRAVQLRAETGDQTIMTEQERHKRPQSEMVQEALIRPLEMLVTEPSECLSIPYRVD